MFLIISLKFRCFFIITWRKGRISFVYVFPHAVRLPPSASSGLCTQSPDRSGSVGAPLAAYQSQIAPPHVRSRTTPAQTWAQKWKNKYKEEENACTRASCRPRPHMALRDVDLLRGARQGLSPWGAKQTERCCSTIKVGASGPANKIWVINSAIKQRALTGARCCGWWVCALSPTMIILGAGGWHLPKQSSLLLRLDFCNLISFLYLLWFSQWFCKPVLTEGKRLWDL